MRKSKKNFENNTSNKLTYVWVVVGIFIIGTVYFTIQVATSGSKLAQLERERMQLTKETQSLSSDLMQQTSLTQIGQRAEEMGFIKPDKIVYLQNQDSVADIGDVTLE